jgi:2-iminoacetate synthase ThiH
VSEDLSREGHALVEGEDFYREGAYVVFTARYHLRRGRCCESGCRHCPYRDAAGSAAVIEEEEETKNEASP